MTSIDFADEYFKTNNWEPFYQQAETNYPLDSIQTIINLINEISERK